MSPTCAQSPIEPLEARIAPATFVVTSIADSGPGTLRQAILDANTTPAVDTIAFAIGGGSKTIQPDSELPSITAPLVIDGSTQPGFSGGAPIISIYGKSAGAGIDGLSFEGVTGEASIVRSLSITNFASDGISVKQSTNISIEGCLLGSVSGTGNGECGIRVTDSSAIVIGGASPTYEGFFRWGKGNIIGGNLGDGISVLSTDPEVDTTVIVKGNFIGLAPSGRSDIPNAKSGISISGGNGHIIGGESYGDANSISANGLDGISLLPGTGPVEIKGNYIGQNKRHGIFSDGVAALTVGGKTEAARNVIAANLWQIYISGSKFPLDVKVAIQGNYIGSDGYTAIQPPGLCNGIMIVDSADVLIGGISPGEGNLISSSNHGVELNSSFNCTVAGNLIGTNQFGTHPLWNDIGIVISGGGQHTIGGPEGRNIISGNRIGILSGDMEKQPPSFATSQNKIYSNYIGTAITGTNVLPNQYGIFLGPNSSNDIVGGAGKLRNVISANSFAGIAIMGSSETISGNYIGTDSTGGAALGNGSVGIVVGTWPAYNNLIEKNVISGNRTGVDNWGANVTISGNIIGLNASGTGAIPNLADGVRISRGSNLTISGNTIAGNFGNGIADAESTSGLVIRGNKIGVSSDLMHAFSNGGHGIQLGYTKGTRVGGPDASDRNIIAGNAGSGILALSGNTIEGNFIGTTGTHVFPNGGHGINLSPSLEDGVIRGNLIGGNGGDGIHAVADHLLIVGNRIGTDGIMAIPNGGDGIYLAGKSDNVGGESAELRNVISGNRKNGITVTGSNHVIEGNYIGVSDNGDGELGNLLHGVSVSSTGVVLRGNVISANGGAGIHASGTGNVITANVIGLDASMTEIRGNGGDGVFADRATDLLISENRIAGNKDNGIEVSVSSETVRIRANVIGLSGDVHFTSAGNGGNGIEIGPIRYYGTTIGGTQESDRNIIAGNGQSGIEANASVSIYHNYIGTDGLHALPNGGDGITSGFAGFHGDGNWASIKWNLISGNAGDGIRLRGDTFQIIGNLIGTDAAGMSAIPNGGDGIDLIAAPSSGPDYSISQNVISGNLGNGLRLGSAALLFGNIVGAAKDGVGIIGNGLHGIIVSAGASGSSVFGGSVMGNGLDGIHIAGGTGMEISGNTIAGNLGDGISTTTGLPTGLVIRGNKIGVTGISMYVFPNGGNGISLGKAKGVLVGGPGLADGNLIAGNTGDGIFTGSGNTIEGNSIGTNGTSVIPNGGHGINLTGSEQSFIRGNLIGGNNGDGIHAMADYVIISDNRIGTDGFLALANGGDGIDLSSYADLRHSSIRGNLISGNTGNGIRVSASAGIWGNFIGVDSAHSAAIPNWLDGIRIEGGPVTVGGGSPEVRNIISGNRGHGINLQGSEESIAEATIVGNYVGIDASGEKALGNVGDGIRAGGKSKLRIVPANGFGFLPNVISGNGGDGIHLAAIGNADAVIEANLIGVGSSGGAPLGNGGAGLRLTDLPGITISDLPNVIGHNAGGGIVIENPGEEPSGPFVIRGQHIGSGTAGDGLGNGGNGVSAVGPARLVLDSNQLIDNAAHGVLLDGGATAIISNNTIVHNGGDGVRVLAAQAEISRNAIFDNGGLPVDLRGDGPTLNDPLDADSLQNSLKFHAIKKSSGEVAIVGNYEGAAWQSLRVEFITIDANGVSSVVEKFIQTFGQYNARVNATLPALPLGATVYATVTGYNISTHGYSTSEYTSAIVTKPPVLLAAGTSAGVPATLSVFDLSDPTAAKFTFKLFGETARSGARVAVGDVDGDGFTDVITTPERGIGVVRVFSGFDGELLASFSAAPASYRGAITVAAGDTDGDGVSEIITALGRRGAPVVSIRNGLTGEVKSTFTAGTARTGLYVAAGDLDGDGRAEIVTSKMTGVAIAKVFSADGSQRGAAIPIIGRSIAILDAAPGGEGRIVVGSGEGRRSMADILTPGGTLEARHILAAAIRGTKSLRVAVADVNFDGIADIIAARSHHAPPVAIQFTQAGALIRSDLLFDPRMTAGIHIAA